jgi:hypothetical protein
MINLFDITFVQRMCAKYILIQNGYDTNFWNIFPSLQNLITVG